MQVSLPGGHFTSPLRVSSSKHSLAASGLVSWVVTATLFLSFAIKQMLASVAPKWVYLLFYSRKSSTP